MTQRILALTRYGPKGASSRVRFLQYLPHLEQAGFDVTVSPLLSDEYLERLYTKGGRSPAATGQAMRKRMDAVLSTPADLIWLQREAVPWLPFGLEEGMLRGRKLVIDYDDAHHLYYKESGPAFLRPFLKTKIERLMARADAVTVGNPTLARVAELAGARRIEQICSAVDCSRFDPSSCSSLVFTVGWIGTPLTAAQSLPMIEAPLRRFLAQTESRCVLMGAGPDVLADLPAERREWSEQTEAAFMADIHVGLCPLPDTAWSRGKSGYKILQYFAAGRPALASPVGIAEDLVAEENTGFACDTEADWLSRLTHLSEDQARAQQLGKTARQKAEALYDTSVAAAKIVQLFKDVLNG